MIGIFEVSCPRRQNLAIAEVQLNVLDSNCTEGILLVYNASSYVIIWEKLGCLEAFEAWTMPLDIQCYYNF